MTKTIKGTMTKVVAYVALAANNLIYNIIRLVTYTVCIPVIIVMYIIRPDYVMPATDDMCDWLMKNVIKPKKEIDKKIVKIIEEA